MLRMSQPSMSSFSVEVPLMLPTLRTRQQILSSHPVEASKVYKQLIEALFEYLIGLRPDHVTRKSHPPVCRREQGALGVPLAFVGVTEMQGRQSAHLHCLVMSDMSPISIQKHLADNVAMSLLMKRLDSMIQGWIPDVPDQAFNKLSDEGTTMEPTKLHRDGRQPMAFSSMQDVEERAFSVAHANNRHSHSFTCHKGQILQIISLLESLNNSTQVQWENFAAGFQSRALHGIAHLALSSLYCVRRVERWYLLPCAMLKG